MKLNEALNGMIESSGQRALDIFISQITEYVSSDEVSRLRKEYNNCKSKTTIQKLLIELLEMNAERNFWGFPFKSSDAVQNEWFETLRVMNINDFNEIDLW